ncbi:MAG TPA: hypothetical protein PL110_13755 [Candidatus Eremiobacteraeota bacterium]|nr:hypothetical protein [Candidatus Eremiobacteraeota bacterium]
MDYKLNISENQNEKLDCLFVHIPKTTDESSSILIMPMGIIALADLLCKEGVNTRVLNLAINVYFTVGLPFENKQDVLQTKNLINHLINRYECKVNVFPSELEPASLVYLYPERYGVTLKRKSFMDFYNQHNNRTCLGYSTNYFTEEEMKKNIQMLQELER